MKTWGKYKGEINSDTSLLVLIIRKDTFDKNNMGRGFQKWEKNNRFKDLIVQLSLISKYQLRINEWDQYFQIRCLIR